MITLRPSTDVNRKSYSSEEWILNDVRSREGYEEDHESDYRSPSSEREEFVFNELDDEGDSTVISNGCEGAASLSKLQHYTEREDPDTPIVPSPRRNSDVMLGLQRTRSFDPNLFNIRQVSAEKVAEQLTLIDLSLLKSINIDEFRGCKFARKDRISSAPNIVKFSRRFNHTSFWVVRDILNEVSTKSRAEIIVLFLRIARHLQELNNIHSLVAVVLAIQSPPIERLTQTWKFVPKKEKVLLDRLSDFVSEEDNYGRLRDHMSKVIPPCVPHLGIHQKDLIYLDELSKRSGATEKDKREYQEKVDAIYELIDMCQSSKYDGLMPVNYLQKYLNSLRFIDELQKFYEDDNYKLSLEREPPPKLTSSSVSTSSTRPPPYPKFTCIRNSKSNEDLLGTPLKPEVSCMLTPPRRPSSGRFSESDLLRKNEAAQKIPQVQVTEVTIGNSLHSTPQKFSKPFTLPGNMRDFSFSELTKEGGKIFENDHLSTAIDLKRKMKSASPSFSQDRKKFGHSKSQSLGTNVLSALGAAAAGSKSQIGGNGRKGGSSPDLPPHPISLLDDSLLDDTLVSTNQSSAHTEYFTPPISTASSSSMDVNSFDEDSEVFLQDSSLETEKSDLIESSEIIREGPLRRKVLVKDGQAKQLKLTHKYWVKLSRRSIVIFRSKYIDSSKKENKLKHISLASCRVKYNDPSTHIKATQFLLVDEKGNQAKFTADNSQDASSWVNDIRKAIDNFYQYQRQQEQKTPLIKL